MGLTAFTAVTERRRRVSRTEGGGSHSIHGSHGKKEEGLTERRRRVGLTGSVSSMMWLATISIIDARVRLHLRPRPVLEPSGCTASLAIAIATC